MMLPALVKRLPLSRFLGAATTCGMIVWLTGCGLGGSNVTTTSASAIPGAINVSGQMHGGYGAINGATIQLYEVGATGYTTGLAKPLLSQVTTVAPYGSYSITGDYTCDAGTYVYLTGSGGNAGAGTNNNIALMAALGPCAQLATQTTRFVTMNEVTTVAAAYALAQFSGGTAFGTTLVAKPGIAGSIAPADNFTTSASNTQGVANAMAVAAVLANTTSGTSPGNNTNGSATVEYYTVNTIADLLSTCIQSAGGAAGDTTPCGKLFTATTPTGGVAPADTIQAALQLALHPGDAALLAGTPSGSTLDALIAPQGPYLPYVNTTVPGNTINDWTIAVSYAPVVPSSSTTLLSQANQVAIDGFGNAWVSNIGTGNKSLVELGANGDPIQAGPTAGVYAVTSYNAGGTTTAISEANATAVGGNYGIAFDSANNAWATDYGTGYIFEVTKSGAQFGSGTTFESTTNQNGGNPTQQTAALNTGFAASHPTGIAFDASDDAFVLLYGGGGTSPTGTCPAETGTETKNIVSFFKSGSVYGAPVYGSSAGSNQSFLAIDNGNTDNVAGTANPGAPYVWWLAEASGGTENHGTSGHYDYLFQAYTGAGGTTSAGCNTAAGSISSSASAATTKIAENANGGDTTDIFNNAVQVAFDNSNNLWTANNKPVDANNTYTNSFTKFTPSYSLVSSAVTLSGTYATYTGGGATASGFTAFAIAVDGNGSVFASDNGTKAIVAAVGNSGTGLAPSTGFTGTTYASSSDGTNYTGFNRPISTSASVAIDPSGNVWITSGAATPATVPSAMNNNLTVASVPATNVVQIVGVAAPVQTPISAAAAAHNLGAKP